MSDKERPVMSDNRHDHFVQYHYLRYGPVNIVVTCCNCGINLCKRFDPMTDNYDAFIGEMIVGLDKISCVIDFANLTFVKKP